MQARGARALSKLWRPWIGWALAGLIGAVLAVLLFGAQTYRIGPFQVRLELAPGSGETVLLLPPVGSVRAHTHRTPVTLAVELRTVDVDSLTRLAARTEDAAAAVADLRAGSEDALRRFGVRTLLLSLLGAAGVGTLVGRNEARRAAAVAAATAGLATALLLGITWSTYDLDAFREPDYSGVLEAAPWMIGLAERALVEADRLGDRLATIAESLQEVFARIEQLEPVGARPGQRSLVIVSDIHNNLAALEFTAGIVDAFQAELVIDAGDLTDWGTVFEARLLDGIERIPVPYVLVPGNHESPALLARLEALSNVRILWIGEIDVNGLHIAGMADPAAYLTSPAVSAGDLRDAAAELRLFLEGLAAPPDVLVVHNPALVATLPARLTQEIPLLVSGHTHRHWIRRLRQSWWINPGTAGAAGLRGLEGSRVPYSLMLVHLEQRDGRWHPIAVDRIQVSNFQTGFSVERHVLDRPARSPETQEMPAPP
ncbi:MAG TPA: metallophosphoesterase family protein [Bacillota bacterium]